MTFSQTGDHQGKSNNDVFHNSPKIMEYLIVSDGKHTNNGQP